MSLRHMSAVDGFTKLMIQNARRNEKSKRKMRWLPHHERRHLKQTKKWKKLKKLKPQMNERTTQQQKMIG